MIEGSINHLVWCTSERVKEQRSAASLMLSARWRVARLSHRVCFCVHCEFVYTSLVDYQPSLFILFLFLLCIYLFFIFGVIVHSAVRATREWGCGERKTNNKKEVRSNVNDVIMMNWAVPIHSDQHRRGAADYESIFLATVMQRGPRIIRIISIISWVGLPSTISSLIWKKSRKAAQKRENKLIQLLRWLLSGAQFARTNLSTPLKTLTISTRSPVSSRPSRSASVSLHISLISVIDLVGSLHDGCPSRRIPKRQLQRRFISIVIICLWEFEEGWATREEKMKIKFQLVAKRRRGEAKPQSFW